MSAATAGSGTDVTAKIDLRLPAVPPEKREVVSVIVDRHSRKHLPEERVHARTVQRLVREGLLELRDALANV